MNALFARNEGIQRAVAGTGYTSRARAHRYGFLLALLLLQLVAGTHAQISRGDQIRAAFLYNFTKFIEWPSNSFTDVNAAIVIGVLGDSSLAAALTAVVRDRKVNGRPITVRAVQNAEEAASTHELFVSATEISRWAQIQAAIETRPVVTVGESPAFARNGGTINFIVQDDKLRFEINMTAAERSGVKISAQLQKLAAAVERVP